MYTSGLGRWAVPWPGRDYYKGKHSYAQHYTIIAQDREYITFAKRPSYLLRGRLPWGPPQTRKADEDWDLETAPSPPNLTSERETDTRDAAGAQKKQQ